MFSLLTHSIAFAILAATLSVAPDPSDARSSWIPSINRQKADDNLNYQSRVSIHGSDSSYWKKTQVIGVFPVGWEGKPLKAETSAGAARFFDFDTARIESIRMEVDCIGQLHYVATLVDAHGVTIDVEIEPEFGAELYETMTNSW